MLEELKGRSLMITKRRENDRVTWKDWVPSPCRHAEYLLYEDIIEIQNQIVSSHAVYDIFTDKELADFRRVTGFKTAAHRLLLCLFDDAHATRVFTESSIFSVDYFARSGNLCICFS